jgi:methyl coenzyme M reductase subunit D
VEIIVAERVFDLAVEVGSILWKISDDNANQCSAIEMIMKRSSGFIFGMH